MQTPQQVIAAKIARTREIPDDNSEIPTTLFSRRLAIELAEQGGVGFIGEVHGIRQIG